MSFMEIAEKVCVERGLRCAAVAVEDALVMVGVFDPNEEIVDGMIGVAYPRLSTRYYTDESWIKEVNRSCDELLVKNSARHTKH